MKKIAVGADHGGLDIKNAIVEALSSAGYEVKDFGTMSAESVDYPDVVHALAPEVASGQFDFGVLCCTSGIGVSITANKYVGIRAAKVDRLDEVATTREHNDSNIICLGQSSVNAAQAVEMVQLFLETEAQGGRHERRVCKASGTGLAYSCLLYTSPSPRDGATSRMPSSA